MKQLLLTMVLAVGVTTTILAQDFGISAEIRPRYENKHGYKTLLKTDADGSNFISQRTRLNFDFKKSNLKLKLSMQNVRVWGDVKTLSADDNATSLHEAWAEFNVSEKLALKLGRQEIAYDDQRIFGSVGWAQQARSHDALVVKYTPNSNNRLDVGFALNADSQSGVDNLYTKQHKAFQYAWYHGKFNNFGASLLFLNTGFESLDSDNEQAIDYVQTMGTRVTYAKNQFDANASVYVQTGELSNSDVKALNYALNLGYKVSNEFKLGVGYEYLSGKDMDDTDSDLENFNPLFGTNHKFNGWMDYFYVGFGNSTGLNDLNATLSYKKDKFSAKLVSHFFSSVGDVYDASGKMGSSLGTELDLALGYKLSKDISLNVGHSQMFATDTMEFIKGGDSGENNSWTWAMFTFKPKLFSTSK